MRRRLGAAIVVCLWNLTNLLGQNIPKCSELFFSEYVEGSRNNKALEIFNPTNNAINLNQYRIVRWPNGSAQFATTFSQKLSGIIPSKKTVVLVIDKRDTTKIGIDTPVVWILKQKATFFLGNTDSFNFSMNFNGDDALSLEKYNSQSRKYIAVDIFGKIGEKPNPCWSDKFPYQGEGNWYSMDRTLVRKPWVTTGIDTIENGVPKSLNPTSFFNPTVEWFSHPKDMFDSLGSHHCNCENAGLDLQPEFILKSFPNPTTGKVVLNVSHLSAKEVYLFSITGDVIPLKLDYHEGYMNEKLALNLDLLKSGVYICVVKLLDKSTVVGKIIKI